MLRKRLESFIPTSLRGMLLLTCTMSLVFGLAIGTFIAPKLGEKAAFSGPRRDGYWELATNLIQGNGYVFETGGPAVFHRPPLVPALFAPLTLLPEALEPAAVILLHGLMIGLTCWLTFDMTRRVFGTHAARWTVVMLLGYPWIYWHVRLPLNVVTQMACTAIVLYLLGRELLRAREQDAPDRNRFSPMAALAIGLAAGAAILTHGTMLLSVPALLALTAYVGLRLGSTRTVKVCVAAGLLALLTVAPWTYRNWCVTGRFMPVVGGAGLQYFYGHVHWGYDGYDHEGKQWQRIVAASVNGTYDDLHYAGFRDPALDAKANRHMIEDIQSRPGRFAQRVVLNAVEFYIPSIHDILMPNSASRMGAITRAGITIWHLGLLTLLGIGFRRYRGYQKGAVGFAAVAIVALAGCYVPFVTDAVQCHYVLPTLPLLAFAGAAVLVPKSAADKGRGRPRFTATVVGEDRSPAGREAVVEAA